MNQAEYAARHSVSRKTVTAWKQRGWLVFKGDDIDPDASDLLLAHYRKGGAPGAKEGNSPVLPGPQEPSEVTKSPDIGGQVTEPGFDSDAMLLGPGAESAASAYLAAQDGLTLDEAKRLKENYLARLAQLEYDTKSGRVVEAAVVAEKVGAEYSEVRTKLLAIPAEQAPRIHRCRTVAEVQDTLRDIITRILEGLTADTL